MAFTQQCEYIYIIFTFYKQRRTVNSVLSCVWSRYVQPPRLVIISKSNFYQIWQKFTNPFCLFDIKELCQLWPFKGCQFLLNIYNSVTHFGINSGSLYVLMFAILGKKCPLFLYFYISAYIAGLDLFIILAKFGKNSQNFCKLTVCATKI